jgi:hypothetical protein
LKTVIETTEERLLRLAQKKAQIDLLRLTSKGYPVTSFFNDTLLISTVN